MTHTSIFHIFNISCRHRLGFGRASTTASARKYENTLVLCVVGGISLVEVAQIQAVLSAESQWKRSSGVDSGHTSEVCRVIVVSTNICTPEKTLSLMATYVCG